MGQKQTKQRQRGTSGGSSMEGVRKSSTASSTAQFSMRQTITERVTVNGQVVKNVVNTTETTGTQNIGTDFSKIETYKSQPARSAFSLTTPKISYKPIYERNLSGDGMPMNRTATKPTPSSSTATVLSRWNPPAATSAAKPTSVPIPKPYTPTSRWNPPATTSILKPTSVPTTKPYTPTYPPSPTVPTVAAATTSAPVQNLVIKVKKNKRFHDGATLVPTYSTHGKSRGSLFLINNVEFEKKDMYRKGAEVDEKNIKSLFSKMGFQVQARGNLKADIMKKVLKDYSKSSSLKYVDINVVVLMSHGSGNKSSGSTVIVGSDDREIHMAEVVEIFNNQNCPNLIDKPKIFIFQCCRGGAHQQSLATDAVPFQYNKETSDILLAFSTIPGYVSFRDKCVGTYYIRAICEIFMEYACDYHVEDLLKMVEAKMNKLISNTGGSQTSSYENWGFKRCYLHP